MMTQKPNNKLRKVLKRLLWTVVILAAFLVVDYWAYPAWSGVGGKSINTGQNGLWLRYTWYFGKESDKDLNELTSRLRDEQIRYAYFHVRAIKRNGTLKYRYEQNAKKITETIHRKTPEVKPIAWVYIGNDRGLSRVDITKPAVRKSIIEETLWLVRTCGFDGVQIDYEICRSGEDGFLIFMRELRKVFPKEKLLSVATPLWLPSPALRWGGWSDDYFTHIAANCDQMAVMSYDSAAYTPRVYVWLMREQVIHVSRAAAKGNPSCKVIFGLPTYEDGTPSHNPHSENLRLALKGVREGLADRDANPDSCEGIALFADYTTDQDEWYTYQKLWLGHGLIPHSAASTEMSN